MSASTQPTWRKLGIVAGAGELPLLLARACKSAGLEFHISRLGAGINPALDTLGGDTFELGEIGRRLDGLKSAGCDAVTMVGILKRPDFKSLKVDGRGALFLPKAIMAARKGDDALLTVIAGEFEREGFKVIGVQEVARQLLAPEGLIAGPALNAEDLADIRKGAQIAAAIGALDIGQGCVVCHGLVLAVEAQEGTDAMLDRVALLPANLLGGEMARAGALVKRPKPGQELRVDLPTIGIATIERAARAGLKAVAFQAGASLLINQDECAAAATRLGVSLYGFSPKDVDA